MLACRRDFFKYVKSVKIPPDFVESFLTLAPLRTQFRGNYFVRK